MKPNLIRSIAGMCLFLFTFTIRLPAAYAETRYQPSSWAAQKIDIAKTAGIIPENFDTLPYSQNITRRDFCQLLVYSCVTFGIKLPGPPKTHPFTDTRDLFVENAYTLGLAAGTGDGKFNPEHTLTREMAAVMLSKLRILFQSTANNNKPSIDWTNPGAAQYADRNRVTVNDRGTVAETAEGFLTYTPPLDGRQAAQILTEYASDSSKVSSWAQSYMADVYSLGILAGVGGSQLNPKGDLTREQAVSLAMNVLTYSDESKVRGAGVAECVLPNPAGIFIPDTFKKGEVSIRWNDIPAAAAYDVTVYKDGKPAYTTRVRSNYLDLAAPSTGTSRGDDRSTGSPAQTNALYSSIFGNESQNIQAGVKIVPVDANGEPSMFSLTKDFTIGSPGAEGPPAAEDTFVSNDVTKGNLTTVQIRVWKLSSSGTKSTEILSLTVRKDLAEDVKKIFEEIYNGPEKFPIKAVEGQSSRGGKSEHNSGTAIDINPEENYFISSNGKIQAGKLWEPGENPYSISPDGDVVRAFKKYGWNWSPEMGWSNGKDYMHFSLNGT